MATQQPVESPSTRKCLFPKSEAIELSSDDDISNPTQEYSRDKTAELDEQECHDANLVTPHKGCIVIETPNRTSEVPSALKTPTKTATNSPESIEMETPFSMKDALIQYNPASPVSVAVTSTPARPGQRQVDNTPPTAPPTLSSLRASPMSMFEFPPRSKRSMSPVSLTKAKTPKKRAPPVRYDRNSLQSENNR